MKELLNSLPIELELACNKMAPAGECVCYIISTHYGTYYTGITNNLIRRWREHVDGKSSYLRRYRAKEVVWLVVCDSRATARSYEVMIKRTGAWTYLVKQGFLI